jgi:hypothetical protein
MEAPAQRARNRDRAGEGTHGEKGAMVCYRQREPIEMLWQVFWRLGFIQLGVYAPWKQLHDNTERA